MKKKTSGGSSTLATTELIKGYLPVRLLTPSSLKNQDHDETFMFVKEHRSSHSAENSVSASTLFVANVPLIPGVKGQSILQALLGRFGDIRRVTMVENLRKQTGPSSVNFNYQPLSKCLPLTTQPQKFAHVVFSSTKDLRFTLKELKHVMKSSGEGSLTLDRLELQMLQDERESSEKEESSVSGNENDKESDDKIHGIFAVLSRYAATQSRESLMEHCNEIMNLYEESEEKKRTEALEQANKADEDGFITVGMSSTTENKSQLEAKGSDAKRRRNGRNRNRQKKNATGASELTDFYRFQRKESRKRTLQDLRKQFEEDLTKVKRMKEEGQYKPF